MRNNAKSRVNDRLSSSFACVTLYHTFLQLLAIVAPTKSFESESEIRNQNHDKYAALKKNVTFSPAGCGRATLTALLWWWSCFLALVLRCLRRFNRCSCSSTEFIDLLLLLLTFVWLLLLLLLFGIVVELLLLLLSFLLGFDRDIVSTASSWTIFSGNGVATVVVAVAFVVVSTTIVVELACFDRCVDLFAVVAPPPLSELSALTRS